jgi:hypothetical protein
VPQVLTNSAQPGRKDIRAACKQQISDTARVLVLCSEGQRPFGNSKSMGAGRLMQQSVSSSAFQMHDTVQQQHCVSYTNLEDFSSKVEIYKGRCAGVLRMKAQQHHVTVHQLPPDNDTRLQSSTTCFCDSCSLMADIWLMGQHTYRLEWGITQGSSSSSRSCRTCSQEDMY